MDLTLKGSERSINSFNAIKYGGAIVIAPPFLLFTGQLRGVLGENMILN